MAGEVQGLGEIDLTKLEPDELKEVDKELLIQHLIKKSKELVGDVAATEKEILSGPIFEELVRRFSQNTEIPSSLQTFLNDKLKDPVFSQKLKDKIGEGRFNTLIEVLLHQGSKTD